MRSSDRVALTVQHVSERLFCFRYLRPTGGSDCTIYFVVSFHKWGDYAPTVVSPTCMYFVSAAAELYHCACIDLS